MREEIAGEKIILRRYEIGFAPLLFAAASESKGGEFSRWMPWCHENYTLGESEFFISRSLENWKNQAEYDFAIFESKNGVFSGGVSLNLLNRERGSANLGYWVRTKSQRRGIASAAAKILARTGFEELNLHRVEIAVAVENHASQKAAEKAGATREGVLRKLLNVGGEQHDAVMFSFVGEDFQKQK